MLSRNALPGGLKQFDLDKAVREVIAIANIMLNAAWPEIAATLRQLVDIGAARMFNLQPSVRQRHNDVIMLMTVPSGRVAFVGGIPPRYPGTVIFDDYLSDGLAGLWMV